jgi:predicted transcriptional regulator
MAKVVISFKIDEKIKTELQKLAERDQRSLSNYISKILQEHLQAKGIGLDRKKPSKK